MPEAPESTETVDVEVDDAAPEADAEIESDDQTTDVGVEDDGADGVEVDDDVETFTIKVGGETKSLTRDEVIRLAQMGEDYTQKTQALASEREQLASLRAFQEAMERDPSRAIEALAQAYGIEFAGKAADAEDEELDPLEREVKELRQWREQQEQASRQAQIVSEAERAISDAQLEVSPEELLQFAIDTNVGSLAVAAELMVLRNQRETAAQRKQETTEKKRKAAVVEGGRTRASDTTKPVKPSSVREAWEAAKRQLAT